MAVNVENNLVGIAFYYIFAIWWKRI